MRTDMRELLYPGELEAAAKAMKDRREFLIGQPLSRIWEELAIAGLEAAAIARHKYMDDELAKLG